MSICGVIPAAGRGSRLGFDKPKLLVDVTDTLTIWDILKANLLTVCDHLVVVMSPSGEPLMRQALEGDPFRNRISVVQQPSPIGMGDAVMVAEPVWSRYDDICIVWGDQVALSRDTMRRCTEKHITLGRPRMTIPLTRLEKPYVEYRFDDHGRLKQILQSREGDECAPGGFGDVGAFFLSTQGIREAFNRYIMGAPTGEFTNEINFLPFLLFLSEENWDARYVDVADADEACGINTREDLERMRRRFLALSGHERQDDSHADDGL